eukprot:1579064-Pleurochrysis_carterae.AAC.2
MHHCLALNSLLCRGKFRQIVKVATQPLSLRWNAIFSAPIDDTGGRGSVQRSCTSISNCFATCRCHLSSCRTLWRFETILLSHVARTDNSAYQTIQAAARQPLTGDARGACGGQALLGRKAPGNQRRGVRP